MKLLIVAGIVATWSMLVVLIYSLLKAASAGSDFTEANLEELRPIRPGDWMPTEDWTKGVG